MNALGISGSPRAGGNTDQLVKQCLGRLADRGIDTQFVSLSGKSIHPCVACCMCRQGDPECAINDDFAPIFEQMLAADIIVVGSPVYFGSATPELMALLDRAGYVACGNGKMLSRKIGGPIAVARRAGQNFTFAQLLYWYMINDMIVPGSSYWNVAFGREKGEVSGDEEGVQTIDRFAENLAWLAEKLGD